MLSYQCICECKHCVYARTLRAILLDIGERKDCRRTRLPSVFVETNCFWVTSYTGAKSRFEELKGAGLGVLISVNPFTTKFVPYSRAKLAIRAAFDVVDEGGMFVYHPVYLELLESVGSSGKISLEEMAGRAIKVAPPLFKLAFNPSILLPMGRLVYTLGYLYERSPLKPILTCLAWGARKAMARTRRPSLQLCPRVLAGISLGDAQMPNHVLRGLT